MEEEDKIPPPLDPDPALRDPRQVLRRYKLALELLNEALPIAARALLDNRVSLLAQLDFWTRYSNLLDIMTLLHDLTSDTPFPAMREDPLEPRTIYDEIDEIEDLLKTPDGEQEAAK